jgi:O-antigen/teichoic acid export membrane protein
MHKANTLAQKSLGALVVSISILGGQFMVSLAAQISLAHLLEPSDFGEYASLLVFSMFFLTISNLQSDKYIVKNQSTINESVYSQAIVLDIIVTLIMSIFVVLFSDYYLRSIESAYLNKKMLLILSISLYYLPFSRLRVSNEIELNFFKSKFPILVGQIAGAFVSIWGAYSDMGVYSLIYGRLSALASEILLLILFKNIKITFKIDTSIIRVLFTYGFPLMIANVLIFFYWNIDYYLISRLLDPIQLGYYYLAFQISQYVVQLKVAINSVLFPTFAKMRNEKSIQMGYEYLVKLSSIVFTLPLILMVGYSNSIISMVFGEKWLPAANVFTIFMALTLVRGVTQYWDPIFLMFGKTKFLLLLATINSIIIPFLGIILTKAYGIEGMAYAVLISILFITILALNQLKALINISYLKVFLKPILLFASSLGVTYILVAILVNNYGIIIPSILLSMLLHMTISFAFFWGEIRYIWRRLFEVRG